MSAYLGKKQSIEPGFPLNEDQIEILDEGFRLDVATTPTTPPFGRSTEPAGVDPRSDSLSKAYRIIVSPTKAEAPSGFRFAGTHVSGVFCNASAKYAHPAPLPTPRGSSPFDS
jgi:hypothetical protein